MAADVESRKLHNLRVIELRTELGKRNLDKTGVKNELLERLQKALIAEGHDPDQYLFDVEPADSKKTPRSSKRRTMGEGDVEREDYGGTDSSVVVAEEETKDRDQSDEFKEDEENSIEKEVTNSDKENIVVKDEVKTSFEETKDSPEKSKSIDENNDVHSSSDEEKATLVNETAAVEKSDKNENTVFPKEQRINVAKKSITEETKEKSHDTTKEDNEDSINLTIGEDEVKLFGEEEDSTHEKEIKEESKENGNPESEKEVKNEINIKSEPPEAKQDQKATGKKMLTSKITGNSRNLWVSGLSSLTRATDLKTLFSKYGKVVGAKIVTNAKTPGSRCYGYVTMLSADDATSSMQHLNKTELDGRLISVERAKDDGTGPARPKLVKKEADKKKIEHKEEKKVIEEKRKLPLVKSNETETKIEEKKVKDEKKSTSLIDKSEDVNGETKTGSVKSENISSQKDKFKRSGSAKNEPPRNRSRENGRPRSGVLSFQQIKEERERHRLKEKERAFRMEERRRQIERERQREIERRQREESIRLERERMKLKMEREKIEREKAELLKLEREAQRLERERLQREKEEIRRAQMKLEETRRAVKRPLEITRTFEDDRKRRPPSPDRRHVHVSSSSTRKEPPPPPPPPSRNNNNRRGSPGEYVSRRTYDSSAIETSRKEPTSHSSRDKSGKESSRYDHHYQSSHGSDDVRSKEIRHRYPDPPVKSSTKDSGRYDRGGPSENWTRSSSSSISSSAKPFSTISSSGSTAISSRDTHSWTTNSSDRKSDSQPPWARTSSSSTSERWQNSSGSTSGMSMSRGGHMSGTSGMFGSSGSYSDAIPSMGMMSIPSGPSYSDRFDAYKPNLRKY